MRQLKSCGVILFRREPVLSFLLMKHRDRWDLPKGHVDEGETDIACALRELQEETGIAAADIELEPDFCFKTVYDVQSKRFGEACRKTLVIYLARLLRDVPIVLSEHLGYQWFSWNPPHRIQAQTIDPLLAEVERHLK